MYAIEVQPRHVKHAVLECLKLSTALPECSCLITAFAHIVKLCGKSIACMTLCSPPQHGAHCWVKSLVANHIVFLHKTCSNSSILILCGANCTPHGLLPVTNQPLSGAETQL